MSINRPNPIRAKLLLSLLLLATRAG